MGKLHRCLVGGRILIGNTPTDLALDTPDIGTAFNVENMDCPFIVNEAFIRDVPAGDTLDIEYIVEQSENQTGPFTVVPEYDNCPTVCPVVDNSEGADLIEDERFTVILPVECVTMKWARLVVTHKSAQGGSLMQTSRQILVGEAKIAGVKNVFDGTDVL